MLIKNSNSRVMAREAVVLDLGDLAAQAAHLKREATAAAERTIAEARAERARILAGAREEGYAAGKREGFEAGRKDGAAQGRAEALAAHAGALKAVSEKWSSALDAFDAARADMLLDARASLLRLAAAVAEKVTRRAVDVDAHVAAAQLEAAVALVLEPTRLTVEVNPDDEASVREALPALMQRLGGSQNAEVRTSPSMELGSVVLRTDRGEIDASISVQVARACAALLGEGEASGAGTP